MITFTSDLIGIKNLSDTLLKELIVYPHINYVNRDGDSFRFILFSIGFSVSKKMYYFTLLSDSPNDTYNSYSEVDVIYENELGLLKYDKDSSTLAFPLRLF